MAVGGLQQVMRRGSFIIPPSVKKATESFRTEADPLRAFIDEHVRLAPNNKVPRSDVYMEYVAWAAENGFHRMSAIKFYESFITAATEAFSHNVGLVRRKDGRLITGIVLTNSE
jgi:phage/plasmid-associated DNA primase